TERAPPQAQRIGTSNQADAPNQAEGPARPETQFQKGVALNHARLEPGTRTKISDRKTGGSRNWMVYVPTDYTPSRRWPIIYCYHARGAAPNVRPFKETADGKSFILVGMEYVEKENVSVAADLANFNRIHGELL